MAFRSWTTLPASAASAVATHKISVKFQFVLLFYDRIHTPNIRTGLVCQAVIQSVPVLRRRGLEKSSIEERMTDEIDEDDFGARLKTTALIAGMEMFVPPGVVLKEGEEPPLRRLPGSNIYRGPFAYNSKVREAEFVKSSTSPELCPQDKLPEFAIVGRSNVGKSSLVNMLIRRKALAHISKSPGKTRSINHFIVNNSWYLVDLPGYGFAEAPLGLRTSWNTFTKDFFLQSKTLVCVMLLVDATISPQRIDLEYAAWFHQHKIPFTLVFTKCDKKKKAKNGGRKPDESIREFLKSLKRVCNKTPPWIMTSCVTNEGKDALLTHTAQLRNFWQQSDSVLDGY